MAEAHIARLRRLVACPVCQCELFATRDASGLYMKKFVCGALFSALQDGEKVSALQPCGNGTVLAAKLLTEECEGAAS